MQIFHTLRSYPKPTALAIGNFDGVHQGHQAIIAEAKSKGLTPALLTFYPHPSKLFRPDNHALRINTLADNFHLLAKTGLEVIFLQHFHAPFSKTEAEHFIKDDLIARYHAEHIIVGEDFVFGHQRKGNTELLQAAGLKVTCLKPVMVEGAACSSTRIRKAITEGDITNANLLLGRPFAITSNVRQGQQKGRTIGFPTLNLKLREGLVVPRYGVYAVSIAGQKAIANFGVRPTVTEDKTPTLEVHLIQPKIIPDYGDKLTVEFHRFIRPEQRFANIEALQKQIAQDIEAL
jgi:riboflavin kinase/FMN adenylyltransferase